MKKFRVKCVIFNGKFFIKKLIDKSLIVLSKNSICLFLCKVKSCICSTISKESYKKKMILNGELLYTFNPMVSTFVFLPYLIVEITTLKNLWIGLNSNLGI